MTTANKQPPEIGWGGLKFFENFAIFKCLCQLMYLSGLINPGSLMDRLPSKGSAQQTMLRMTRKLLGRPKYLNNRLEGRSNLRPEGLAKEKQRSLPTPARLSDRKA